MNLKGYPDSRRPPGQQAATMSLKWAPERSESITFPKVGLGLQLGAHFEQDGSERAL